MVRLSDGMGQDANSGPTLFHNWANVSCYLGSGLSGNKGSVHPYGSQSNQGQSPNCVLILASVEYN